MNSIEIGWCIAEFCLGEGANVFISDIDEKKIALKKQHAKYNKNLFIHFVVLLGLFQTFQKYLPDNILYNFVNYEIL